MIIIFVFLAAIYENYEPSYWKKLDNFAEQYHDCEIWD